MGEFDLIDRFFHRPARRAVVGVGDDCAVLQPTAGRQLTISTDLLVEGRHFLPTVDPYRLGHKALAVNLSDLAACGAEPHSFLLSLSLPESKARPSFLKPFSQGMLALADLHGIELIGGDTTSGPLTIGVTVLGEVPTGQALLRSGAQEGDELWVSGTPGEARLALEVFRGKLSLPESGFNTARLAMEMPQPRVALGQALRGVATAAIDISDGLIGDLNHIMAQSDVGAIIELARMPRTPVLTVQTVNVQRLCQLAGGDDYELLFTAPPDRHDAVLAIGRRLGLKLTVIGRMVSAEEGVRVRDEFGHPIDLGDYGGFDHFKAE
jgi:thiamine-monophosphate kinase